MDIFLERSYRYSVINSHHKGSMYSHKQATFDSHDILESSFLCTVSSQKYFKQYFCLQHHCEERMQGFGWYQRWQLCKATGLWKVNTEACYVTCSNFVISLHTYTLKCTAGTIYHWNSPLVCTAITSSLPLY